MADAFTGFIVKELYSIGRLESPSLDDAQYETVQEAEIAAIEASIDDGVWAVWENDSGDVLAIVYQSEVYKP